MDTTLVKKQLQQNASLFISPNEKRNQLPYKEITKKSDIIEKVLDYVSPELNQALLKLIAKLQTLENVQLHQEKLQNQKVKDQIQQKKHSKLRLKEELGSEYESSGESNEYKKEENQSQNEEEEQKEIDFDSKSVTDYQGDNYQDQSQKQIAIAEEKLSEQISEEEDTIHLKIQKLVSQSTKHFQQGEEMKEITEVEEEQKISPEKQKAFAEEQRALMEKQKEPPEQKEKFNPLRFLALTIKALKDNNNNKQ